METCPHCEKVIDPERCWCGIPLDEHHCGHNHTPVPDGCECPLFHINNPGAFGVGEDGAYLAGLAREYAARLAVFIRTVGVDGTAKAILQCRFTHQLLKELKRRAELERRIKPGEVIKAIQREIRC